MIGPTDQSDPNRPLVLVYQQLLERRPLHRLVGDVVIALVHLRNLLQGVARPSLYRLS